MTYDEKKVWIDKTISKWETALQKNSGMSDGGYVLRQTYPDVQWLIAELEKAWKALEWYAEHAESAIAKYDAESQPSGKRAREALND